MYNIDYKAIGKRIRIRRKKLGMTQEQLAEKIEISNSHIGEIERGTSICSLRVLVNLAIMLDLNLDILIKGINSDNVNQGFSELLDGVSKENKDLYIKLCENIANTLK